MIGDPDNRRRVVPARGARDVPVSLVEIVKVFVVLAITSDHAHVIDAVGISLGTAGARETPAPGDIRILAAMIHGQPHLVAMKPLSKLEKQTEHYFTPAGGDAKFDFVGDIPGGKVQLTPDADHAGYTAAFAVPLSFLEVPLQPGATLAADVEVLLGGQGARGLQTIARNFLYTPKRSDTSMTDDVPTESRLYPKYWGVAKVE